MLIFLLTILFAKSPTVEVLNITNNEDIIQPRQQILHQDTLYILDEGCECIWIYQDGKLTNQKFNWGQGPKELSRPIQFFSLNENKFWMVHQNGMRISLFDTQMSLLENIPPALSGSTVYIDSDSRIHVDQESAILTLSIQGNVVESISILPDEDMGYPARYLAKSGNDTVLVVTSGSLANKVGYAIFDTQKGEILDHGVFENLLQTRKHDIPKQARNQLFFAATVGSLSFHPQDGYLIKESAVNKEAQFLYLRRYLQEAKAWTSFKISLKKLPGYPHLVQNLGNDEYILVGQEFVATVRVK